MACDEAPAATIGGFNGIGSATARRSARRGKRRFDFQEIARLHPLGNHKGVAFRLRKGVHQGEDVVVFIDDGGGDLSRQDFREDIAVIVGAVKAHRISCCFNFAQPSRGFAHC